MKKVRNWQDSVFVVISVCCILVSVILAICAAINPEVGLNTVVYDLVVFDSIFMIASGFYGVYQGICHPNDSAFEQILDATIGLFITVILIVLFLPVPFRDITAAIGS